MRSRPGFRRQTDGGAGTRQFGRGNPAVAGTFRVTPAAGAGLKGQIAASLLFNPPPMRPPLTAPALFALLGLSAPLGLGAPLGAAEPSEAGRSGGAGAVSAAAVAGAVDAAVTDYLADEALSPAAPVDDAGFLRRATLDVAGRLPSPAELTAFEADDRPAAAKRAAAVDRLLADPGYAANWASLWRDVIFKRATDPRSRLSEQPFRLWLAERLEAGAGWDEVASEVLTATGEAREAGEVGLIMAHRGEGGEVAAEASRIFLGIQIQCAECHDHPYDRWKREDFHALAAYFPRVRVQRVYPTGPDGKPDKNAKGQRTFAVVGDDGGPNREDAARAVKRLRDGLTRRFRFLDVDGDGKLDAKELKKLPGNNLGVRALRFGDADGDGGLSRAEIAALELPAGAGRGNRGEHLMPDLENPEEPGTRVDPRFFLTNAKLSPGLPDSRRRAAAAAAITGNEWFAKATVNRVWTQLVGEGFYTPVDDIGPDRSVRLEPALDALSEGFAANGHDLRWLIRAVLLTELYGTASDSEAPAFAAPRPTRLRANQIYNSVAQVAGLGDLEAGLAALGRTGGRSRGRGAYGTARGGMEQLLEATFGYDPSSSQEELTGDVPQALALMNGPLSARLTSADGFAPLARVLYQNPSDVHAVRALYRLVLIRDPTAAERKIAVGHVEHAETRAAGFEDLMWALLNGAEFLTRR